MTSIEHYFESEHISYKNKKLAVWLADKKENLENAVATGWDCSRVHILVKLRDNTGDTFEIQTIGRIRRTPEAQHYGSDLLDSCYLYTLYEKFTEGVYLALGKDALNATRLHIKPEYKSVTLNSEQKPSVFAIRDKTQILSAISGYMRKQYNLTNDTKRNKSLLETAGFIFNEKIIEHTKSGEIATLANAHAQIGQLNDVTFTSELDTHKYGRLSSPSRRNLPKNRAGV